MWLAQVGRERIEETIDPELTIDRALETYLKKGYSTEWLHQRLLSIRIRNELTEEWQERGVEKGRAFVILTDEISKAWSGMTTRQYKRYKGLKKENLRDNMSDLELVLNMLAEATTTQFSRERRPLPSKKTWRLQDPEALWLAMLERRSTPNLKRQSLHPKTLPNSTKWLPRRLKASLSRKTLKRRKSDPSNPEQV